jgi:hypothetical protein
MKRTWTEVGEEYTRDKQEVIAAMIERIMWRALPCEMGMGPGMAIKKAIKAFKIPRPSRIATSNEMAPYGLIAVEGNYKNGRAHIFLVDDGVSVTPICTDFYAKEEATNYGHVISS